MIAHREKTAAFVVAHSEGSNPRLALEHDLVLLDAEIGWLKQTISRLVEAGS